MDSWHNKAPAVLNNQESRKVGRIEDLQRTLTHHLPYCTVHVVVAAAFKINIQFSKFVLYNFVTSSLLFDQRTPFSECLCCESRPTYRKLGLLPALAMHFIIKEDSKFK